MSRSLLITLFSISLIWICEADAQNLRLCADNKGNIFARSKCIKGQRVLSLKNISVKGETGPTGSTGQQGPIGQTGQTGAQGLKGTPAISYESCSKTESTHNYDWDSSTPTLPIPATSDLSCAEGEYLYHWKTTTVFTSNNLIADGTAMPSENRSFSSFDSKSLLYDVEDMFPVGLKGESSGALFDDPVVVSGSSTTAVTRHLTCCLMDE